MPNGVKPWIFDRFAAHPRTATFALAALGAAIFHGAGLPLPFLFGPMAACLTAALAGAPLKGFGQVSAGARTILGVAVGAALTPALIADLPRMAGSVAMVPVLIAVIGLIGVPWFRRVWGFDGPTAYYAAMPGGLQDMVQFGIEAGGDPRALSLIHATRVLAVVTLAPLVLTFGYGAALTHPVGVAAGQVPAEEIALMVFAALAGWKGGERIGLFGATILGPLILAGALSLAGLLHGRPPREAVFIAQFFIGCGIGVQFTGVTGAELRRAVAAGAGYVALVSGMAAALAGGIAAMGLGRPAEAFLAFAPGGQAEMTVLAIVSGADLGYVIAHHLVRLVLVITGAPVAARLMRR